MSPRFTPITPVWLLPLALAWAACATSPAPTLELPDLEFGVRHYAGTVLTGRMPDPEAADRVPLDDALAVFCRLTYLAEMPERNGCEVLIAKRYVTD